jgi:hypothetical protein
MLRDSVATPAEAAERLMALRPTTRTVVEAAVLVSILDSLLLGFLSGGEFVVPLPSGTVAVPPIAHTALLLASLVLSASAIQVGGRLLGGQGRLPEALLLVVWLEVLAIAIQLVLVILGVLLPPVAGVLGIAGLAVLVWCLVHFTRALHGFRGLGRTFMSLLVGALVIGVALAIVLGFLGPGVSSDV